MGAAPTAAAAHLGIEDRRSKLGCVMPGESPAVFDDALRRLAAAATYLYQDAPRFWYSTQPTVAKLAEDRAEQLNRDQDKVVMEIDQRLRVDLRRMGDFARIHARPRDSADLPLRALIDAPGKIRRPDSHAQRSTVRSQRVVGMGPNRSRTTRTFLRNDGVKTREAEDLPEVEFDQNTRYLQQHRVRWL